MPFLNVHHWAKIPHFFFSSSPGWAYRKYKMYRHTHTLRERERDDSEASDAACCRDALKLVQCRATAALSSGPYGREFSWSLSTDQQEAAAPTFTAASELRTQAFLLLQQQPTGVSLRDLDVCYRSRPSSLTDPRPLFFFVVFFSPPLCWK